MTDLKTTIDVIDTLGGNKAVAVLLGTTAKAVANWRYSGEFPAHTYLALQDALQRRGHTANRALWAMTVAARGR